MRVEQVMDEMERNPYEAHHQFIAGLSDYQLRKLSIYLTKKYIDLEVLEMVVEAELAERGK
jgi:hypothetical protein